MIRGIEGVWYVSGLYDLVEQFELQKELKALQLDEDLSLACEEDELIDDLMKQVAGEYVMYYLEDKDKYILIQLREGGGL